MTYDLNRGGDRSTEPADDDVIVGIPASGAPYTTSWSRVKGWIRRALSSTAPGNTPGSPSAGSSSEVARADHDHGITPGTSGGGTAVSAHTPASGDAELAGIDIAGTDYEIVDDEARERLHEVEQRVHPIVETDRTWADVTDSAVAGWSAPSGLLTSLASIAGLTYSNTDVAGNVDRFVYVRIPVGEKQSNYRFQYTIGGGQQAGETHNRVLGTWSGEKVAVDSNWQYFSISFYEGSTFSAGKVQLGTGEYEWDAAVTKKAVYDQVSEIVKAGSNVTAVNSDSAETVTLSSSGGGGGGASAFSELTGQIAASQIPDDVITRAKIGSAAVGATELGTSSVTTVKLDDDAVTADKLANSINTTLGRVPSASPGNNQVWKTDGSGAPGWRADATGGGSGSPVAVASPQELTPGTSTLQVGGATLGTAMPDNASTQIPITSVGTGTLASGLSSNNFTLKAGSYLIFVHLDEIWNTTSTTNALQYRSIVALEITGTLPAGAVHDPMPHYFRGAIQDDPAEAAGQAYVYLPEDTEIGLALVGYPGVGEDTGNADRNLNYHCTVDEVHIFPMGGIKGDKGDKGDAGTGASSFSELTGQIAASQIPDDVINKDMIASGAVTAVQVQSSAIINSKLAPNSVSADKIIDGVVSTAELADDAVTRAKIGSQAVGSGELGTSAVTTAKLDDVSVTTAKIADDAVTADKIADGVIPTIPDSDEVYGSNTIRKDDTGVLKLRAPDLHSGFWGRSTEDHIVPLGADDPANAVPARLTEVRSNDTRSTAKLSDVVYEATGPQGSPEVEGTIKVLHSSGTFVHGFGSGTGYDATKPGFTWDSTNNRFQHNGVAPSVANSGSTTNKFRLRVEVDYMHHVTVGTSEFSMQLDIDVPQRYGVDRQHQWHNVSTDLGDNEVRTLSYQVDISATSAPATTDHLTVKLTSLQLGSQVEFVEAVRIHFILPDSANISYLQEYDLNNAVSWVGRNVLGPALGSHTDNQSNAGVKITGGRMVATEDLAVLQLISNARTGVAGNGHSIRLMTRIPGLQVPITLHEWDDSTNVWRVVETIKGVVKDQEVWVEADSGATYSSVGSPNFVWDSTKHDSDVDDNLLYPGIITVLTQAQYDALSWVNPYQIYYIEASS